MGATLPTALPFGLRDVKVAALTGADAGLAVDLPNSRTFSFSEAEDTETLRGDDGNVAIHGKGPAVDWSLEAGGISFEALKVFNGGAVTTTGATPSTVKKYKKKATDERPYFRAEGQAISDSGGDLHGIIYRAKADGALEGEMANGAFWLTAASGKGYGSLETGSIDKLYDYVQNETVTAIP